MKRRVLSIVTAVIILIGIIPATLVSAEVSSGNGWNFDSDSGTLTVTTNRGTTEWHKGQIPRTAVKTVVVADGVTFIDVAAFMNCTNLANVTLPEGLKQIVTHAFENCTSLTEITFPEGITSIGMAAFSGCTGLTNVTIFGSRVSIDMNAFYGCTGLTSVVIKGAYWFGWSVFAGCTSLTNVIIKCATAIDDGDLVTIGLEAFYNCPQLKSVTLMNSEVYIDDRAFGFYSTASGQQKVAGFTFYGRNVSGITSYAQRNGFSYVELPDTCSNCDICGDCNPGCNDCGVCGDCKLGCSNCGICGDCKLGCNDCGVCGECNPNRVDCKSCNKCSTSTHAGKMGHILSNSNITTADALEILKYIVKLPGAISDCENAHKAANIIGGAISTADALEILKHIVKLPNKIDGMA